MANGHCQVYNYGSRAFFNFRGGSLSIVVTLLAGLWLVKDKKKGE